MAGLTTSSARLFRLLVLGTAGVGTAWQPSSQPSHGDYYRRRHVNVGGWHTQATSTHFPLSTSAVPTEPKAQLDSAFSAWGEGVREAERAEAERAEAERRQQLLARQINRLAHPDVHLQLVYEGVSRRAVLPGSAKTDALRGVAIRAHSGLSGQQNLRFFLNGAKLPLGVALSESPLANTCDCDVHVLATRGAAAVPGAWWGGAGHTTGDRRYVS